AQAPYLDHVNLVDQLQTHHVSWKAYMESLPYPGFTGAVSSDGLYVLKHDPFMLYPDVASSAARADHVVPLSQLQADLASNHVPAFAWISPNLCNDMHGGVYSGSTTCPYASAVSGPDSGPDAQLQSDGNAFLQLWVTAIMHSSAWTGNSAIFITWDEGSYYNYSPYNPVSTAGCCDSPIIPSPQINTSNTSGGDISTGAVYGGGLVPMIVIARDGARRYQNTQPYNHYSLLRTIEANFDLGYLQNAGDSRQV
ncbi:phosphoesterase, partial [mine drainage metagenome]